MKRADVTWWERAVPGGTAWHYVVLAAELGTPVTGFPRCACGRYRARELTLSPLSAPPKLHFAPADARCLEAMMRSARMNASSSYPRSP